MSEQDFRDAFDEAFAEISSPASGGEDSAEEPLDEAQDEVEADSSDAEESDEAVDEQPEGDAEEEEEQEEQPALTWRDVPPEMWRDIDRARLEDLPEPLRRMKVDRDRLAGRLGEAERQLRELQAQAPKEQPKQQAPENPPPFPPSDADDETYQKMMDAREKWFSEQSALKAVAMINEQQRQREERQQAEMARQQQQRWAQSQVDRISRMEGFTDEVAEVMTALAADNSRPWYGAMIQSEAGIDQLFSEARAIVEGNRVAVQQTTKKATARDRAVPRPKPAPKRVSADIEIPESPDDVSGRVGAIMDAFGG